MAPRKTERLLNLTICLLWARRYLSREHIRTSVEGYAGLSDSAFQRTFERDKDELRALGVPIETGHNEAFFDDELGYRIRRSDFELPTVELTPDEATVVGLATRVWEQARLAGDTATALAKLRAAGVEPDTERLAALSPQVAVREAAFEPLWQATLSHSRVRFGYPGSLPQRHVEPWSVLSRRGSWYLLGHDLDRDDQRMFKLARITVLPEIVSEPGAFTVPPGDELRDLARTLDPTPDALAVVAIRGEAAPTLRRRGRVVTSDAAPAGFTGYEVPYARRADLVSAVAAAGAEAIVLAPPDLRARMIEHLRGIAGGVDGDQ